MKFILDSRRFFQMSFLTWIPLNDVLHETIFPMLDYESRIQLNRFLEPADRCKSQFQKQSILRHELFIMKEMFQKRLNMLNTYGIPLRKKCHTFINILTMCRGKARILFEQYPTLHKTVLQKIRNVCDPRHEDIELASRYFRLKISKLARDILPELIDLQYNVYPKIGILKPISMEEYIRVPVF